jgi:hypothetical protein
MEKKALQQFFSWNWRKEHCTFNSFSFIFFVKLTHSVEKYENAIILKKFVKSHSKKIAKSTHTNAWFSIIRGHFEQ